MRPASAGGGHALEGLLLADLQARSSTWQHAAAVAAAGISCCSPEIGWVAGVGLGAGLGRGAGLKAGEAAGCSSTGGGAEAEETPVPSFQLGQGVKSKSGTTCSSWQGAAGPRQRVQSERGRERGRGGGAHESGSTPP